jgi:hypothetical protein
MAWSVTNMAWAMRDGRRLLSHTAHDGRSNWDRGMRTLQHGVEFLLDCSFPNGEFVAQVRSLPYTLKLNDVTNTNVLNFETQHVEAFFYATFERVSKPSYGIVTQKI